MCTMKIVAKLISFEQIQPSKKQILEKNFITHKNMKTKGSVRVYNLYRVFCEIASLNNCIHNYTLFIIKT